MKCSVPLGPPRLSQQDIKRMRIGLVLGGGGAKGAYQIGVWRALGEYGVSHFSAITATSVGGLNGLLMITTTRDDAKAIWMSLANFKKELNPSKMTMVLWGALGAMATVPWALLIGSFILRHHLFSLPLYDGHMPYSEAFVGLILGGAIWASCGIVCRTWSHIFPYLTTPFILIGGIAFILSVCCGCSIIIFSLSDTRFFRSSGTVVIPLNVAVFVISVLLISFFWAKYVLWADTLHRKCVSRGLLDRAALEKLISQTVDSLGTLSARVDTTLHVTVAQEACLHDPEEFHSAWSSHRGGRGTWSDQWFPNYVDVLSLSLEDRKTAFLNTSALPFAFKNVFTATTSHVDGGILDNLPLAPMLAQNELDLIIVVSLSPYVAAPTRDLAKRLDQNWTLHLKGKYLADPTRSGNVEYSLYKSLVDSTRPSRNLESTKLIFISPKLHLATINLPFFRFLTGTMNFEASVFRLWMRNGYVDAKRTLSNFIDRV
jgi:predicted acylesterase/phospholipase RssA